MIRRFAVTFLVALMVHVVAAGPARAEPKPNAEAAKNMREQSQRLLRGLESVRGQYKAQAAAHAEVAALLEAFVAAKQAEAGACDRLAAAHDQGEAEPISAAAQALTASTEAARNAWEALNAGIAALNERATADRLRGEIDRANRHYGSIEDDEVKQALAAFVKAKEAEIHAHEMIAAAYEKHDRATIRTASDAAGEARQAASEAWTTLRNQGTAAQYRGHARNIRAEGRRFVDQFAKEKDPKLIAAVEAQMQAREADAVAKLALADAYAQARGREEINQLQKRQGETSGVVRLASEAMWARNNARHRRLTKRWIEDNRRSTPKGAEGELGAFIKARRGAEEAWAHVAETASGPGATYPRLEVVKDEAMLADGFANVADRRRYLANDLARYVETAEKPGADDLHKKLDQLRQLHEQLLAAVAQQTEVNVRIRRLERERNDARQACDRAFQKARRRR